MKDLTQQDLLQLMHDLDRGDFTRRNRIRLFAVVDDPCQLTWRNAFGIAVSTRDSSRPLTLWHAVFRFTKRQGPPMAIPTRDRLLMAIHHGTGYNAGKEKPRG